MKNTFFYDDNHIWINYPSLINGRIELDNLANVLGEKSRSEIADLKLGIEKKSKEKTTAGLAGV